MERPKLDKDEVKRRAAEAFGDLTDISQRKLRRARKHAAALIRLFPDRSVRLPSLSEEATPAELERDYRDVSPLVDYARSFRRPTSETPAQDS